jgi:hypothetical protein
LFDDIVEVIKAMPGPRTNGANPKLRHCSSQRYPNKIAVLLQQYLPNGDYTFEKIAEALNDDVWRLISVSANKSIA